ncbi:hypothetical protein [Desulfobulbus oralis]|uniref:hypothetical protein n=1 Tax=Desulfobulbus oralis TaxID=1986146 RepID=UPI0011B066BB|nr:hypothetical protein [Desulfobulbus oralis]
MLRVSGGYATPPLQVRQECCQGLALYSSLSSPRCPLRLPFAPAFGHNERRHPLPCRLLENRIAVLSSVGQKPFRGNTANQRDCLRLFPDIAAK